MPRIAAPIAPTQADYLNDDGSSDYEAFYMADQQHDASFSQWWAEHGKKQFQIDLAWDTREFELSLDCAA